MIKGAFSDDPPETTRLRDTLLSSLIDATVGEGAQVLDALANGDVVGDASNPYLWMIKSNWRSIASIAVKVTAVGLALVDAMFLVVVAGKVEPMGGVPLAFCVVPALWKLETRWFLSLWGPACQIPALENRIARLKFLATVVPVERK